MDGNLAEAWRREHVLSEDELQKRLARVEAIEQGGALHIPEPEVRILN